MTKQEAITKHREMWRWIAGVIEEKRCYVDISILKKKFCIDNHDYYITNNCFLCEYTSNMKANCSETCLLEWPGGSCCANNVKSLFLDVLFERDWERQAVLARQIAELPEKEAKDDK